MDVLLVIEVVKERGEDPPTGVEFVVSDKVRVVALHRVEDQTLISFGNLEIGEAASVGEIELCDNGLHRETGVVSSSS